MAKTDSRPITVKIRGDKDVVTYAVARGFVDIIATAEGLSKLHDPDATTFKIFATKIQRQVAYLLGCINKLERIEEKENKAAEKLEESEK